MITISFLCLFAVPGMEARVSCQQGLCFIMEPHLQSHYYYFLYFLPRPPIRGLKHCWCLQSLILKAS